MDCSRNDHCDTLNCTVTLPPFDETFLQLALTILPCRAPPGVHVVAIDSSSGEMIIDDVYHQTLSSIGLSLAGATLDVTVMQLNDTIMIEVNQLTCTAVIINVIIVILYIIICGGWHYTKRWQKGGDKDWWMSIYCLVTEKERRSLVSHQFVWPGLIMQEPKYDHALYAPPHCHYCTHRYYTQVTKLLVYTILSVHGILWWPKSYLPNYQHHFCNYTSLIACCQTSIHGLIPYHSTQSTCIDYVC